MHKYVVTLYSKDEAPRQYGAPVMAKNALEASTKVMELLNELGLWFECSFDKAVAHRA